VEEYERRQRVFEEFKELREKKETVETERSVNKRKAWRTRNQKDKIKTRRKEKVRTVMK
jgi:cell fate (sporulation/competence/biofilm development) regulator YlbF (YheA/YmcA/DUF963 family)